jgi:hypothetical protein
MLFHLQVHMIGVRMEAGAHKRVRCFLVRAYESMTFEYLWVQAVVNGVYTLHAHLDAGGAAKYGRKDRRMWCVGQVRERRVKRQKPLATAFDRVSADIHVSDSGTIVQ